MGNEDGKRLAVGGAPLKGIVRPQPLFLFISCPYRKLLCPLHFPGRSYEATGQRDVEQKSTKWSYEEPALGTCDDKRKPLHTGPQELAGSKEFLTRGNRDFRGTQKDRPSTRIITANITEEGPRHRERIQREGCKAHWANSRRHASSLSFRQISSQVSGPAIKQTERHFTVLRA